MDKEMRFEELIEIDPLALDKEWRDQPKLFLMVAQQLAEMRAMLDNEKEQLSFLIGKTALDFRMNPEAHDLPQGSRGVTDSTVTAALDTDLDILTKKEEVRKVQEAHDKTKAAVEAFDERKYALQGLVSLHGQSYFATPSEPKDLKPGAGQELRDKQRTARVRRRRTRQAE